MTTKEMLLQYREALELATKLFKDQAEASRWMDTPTDLCFGDSPKACIFTGEGKVLLDWLKVRLNQKEGSAF
jgi:uncharacterized protein (DUF2384 family)